MIYRNHKIRRSGQQFFRIISPAGHPLNHRVRTIEAAKAMIDATVEHRVYTPEEWQLVHGR
jgi:hypothetical protein